MIKLDNAPLVVPKRRNIRVGGAKIGERESLTVEIEKQGLSDIQFLLKAITIAETREQEKIGNPATRLAVDSREAKPLAQAERRTEVTYGDVLDKAVINAVKRSLLQEIRKAVAGRTGTWNKATRDAITSARAWEWIYVAKRGSRGRKVNPYKLGPLPYGARLILRPIVPDVEYENMIALWRDIGYRRPGNIQGKGDKGVYAGRQGGQGFMAKSIDKLKRTQPMKNFSIYVAFTTRYEPAGSKFRKQGAPVIIIRAERKRRRYRKFT